MLLFYFLCINFSLPVPQNARALPNHVRRGKKKGKNKQKPRKYKRVIVILQKQKPFSSSRKKFPPKNIHLLLFFLSLSNFLRLFPYKPWYLKTRSHSKKGGRYNIQFFFLVVMKTGKKWLWIMFPSPDIPPKKSETMLLILLITTITAPPVRHAQKQKLEQKRGNRESWKFKFSRICPAASSSAEKEIVWRGKTYNNY